MAFESKDSKLRRSRDHFSAAAVAQGGGVSGVGGVGVDERCTGLLELQVLRQISKRLTGRTLGEKLALCLCFLLLFSCWEQAVSEDQLLRVQRAEGETSSVHIVH